jgi:hypothetical protein
LHVLQETQPRPVPEIRVRPLGRHPTQLVGQLTERTELLAQLRLSSRGLLAAQLSGQHVVKHVLGFGHRART